MRSSRLVVFVGIVLLACTLAVPLDRASAQDKGDPPAPRKDEGPEAAFAKQMVQVLKHELDLSEEQVEKAHVAIREGMGIALKKFMERMGDETPPSPEQRKKDEAEVREAILGKIRAFLDEGQKREFEVLVKEFDQRVGRWERNQNLPGGDVSIWFEGELPSRERLLLKAENVLLLNEEEKHVVLPRIDAVIKARLGLREARHDQRRDLSRAVHGGAKQDEVKERLHALRDREVQLRRELDRAQEELREIVTLDQEARLVAIGVLD